jgi:internalin A
LKRINNNYIPDTFSSTNKSIKILIQLCICIIITVTSILQPLYATATEATNDSGNSVEKTYVQQQSGELHAFYPAYATFTPQTEEYIDSLDSISFAWSRIDAKDANQLNTEKGKNGNYGFYYPKDYVEPIEYAKSMGKSIQLSVYMDGTDCTKLLPFENERMGMLQAIMNTLETDISGNDIYYDGVVIDFEGLRDTDTNKKPILYNGKQISTYFTQFLEELRVQLDSMDKTLYVAVNPALYYDGFDYSAILEVADRVIVMAHDYEPMEKLQKYQVQQYMGYNSLMPINSLAPIQKIRTALNDMKHAASEPSDLSKVWLQISFDAAQWQFDVNDKNDWNKLPDNTISRKGRISPLYKTIKSRVDNTDGYGQNILYGYNNELQSPFIQYYNSSDNSFNVLIYEDSNSISAKIDLAQSYNLGGISLWSLYNLPDYNDSTGEKYHLDVWETILKKINSYDTLPSKANEYVSFTDGIVEQAIREKLGKPSGKISVWEMQNICRLKLPKGVISLKDIKLLTNLEYLDARELNLKDVTAIGSLKKLRVLYLQSNAITDISSLKKLSKLEILSLSGNQIKSISALSSLTNLKYLDLSTNKISSINALKKLTGLENLYLQRNSISDISTIGSLKKVTVLSLNGNNISDIKPLAKLTSLEKIYLKDNKIKSIAYLKGLVNLTELYLNGNSISNYSPVNKVYTKTGFLCDFKIN